MTVQASAASGQEPIVQLLPYQRRVVESPSRFMWCCWSRQSGKSFALSLRRVLRGIARRRLQVILSAGERQSREVMLKVRQHCQALKMMTELRSDRFFRGTSFKQMEVVLPNGVRIIGLPANPTTARGFTGDVFLDEFAMHRDDRQIWAAMLPTLLRGDGEIDVASTPQGRSNVFARLADNQRFEHSTVTLPQAIADGLRADLQQIRSAMADEQLFRQEFLCEFLDEATAFVSYQMIAGCEDPSLDKRLDLEALSADRADLFAGIDIGRRRDLTVIWVWRRQGDGLLVTAGLVELSRANFAEQQQAIASVLSIRQLRRCCIDAGGLGMQLAEQAVQRFGAHRVEPVTFTAALKSQLALLLRVKLEQQQIRLPVDEAIRNDLHAVQRSITAGGQVRFEADRSGAGHADRFWAAALGLYAAELSNAGPAEYVSARPLVFGRIGIW